MAPARSAEPTSANTAVPAADVGAMQTASAQLRKVQGSIINPTRIFVRTFEQGSTCAAQQQQQMDDVQSPCRTVEAAGWRGRIQLLFLGSLLACRQFLCMHQYTS
jgi:hypothetical protein